MGTVFNCSYLKHFTTCGPAMLFLSLFGCNIETFLFFPFVLFFICVPAWDFKHTATYLSGEVFHVITRIKFRSTNSDYYPGIKNSELCCLLMVFDNFLSSKKVSFGPQFTGMSCKHTSCSFSAEFQTEQPFKQCFFWTQLWDNHLLMISPSCYIQTQGRLLA